MCSVSRDVTSSAESKVDDRCVICAVAPTRHGGLCCAHRYDEQPPCDECPPDTAACDAVSYEPVKGADYDMEIRCTEDATVEVVLSDGRPHPRCPQHVPAGFRALGRSL